MRPIAILGNLSRDAVPGVEPRVGGGPYYAALALRGLRRPGVRVLAKSAAANRSLLLSPLLAVGLPVAWRPAEHSTGFEIVDEGDRREMRVTSIGDPWTPEEASDWIAPALGEAQWLHLSPLLRGDFPAETLAQLARDGRRISLDGQGLVRRREVGPLTMDGELDREELRHVTALKLSEEEALALVGGLDQAALAALEVPELLVTRGSRGCLLIYEGELVEIAAHPPLDGVPGTGAGDAFSAIYVASRARGHAPARAARAANAFVAGFLARRAARPLAP